MIPNSPCLGPACYVHGDHIPFINRQTSLPPAPHVVYKTDKKPDEPCSITTSLTYFPDDEATESNVTAPPKSAPSNLTVVTVEGCPSFVILDWEKTDNDTTGEEIREREREHKKRVEKKTVTEEEKLDLRLFFVHVLVFQRIQ